MLYIYIKLFIRKLIERKVSGSTGADHRGIDRHEINFDFVFLNIHKKINKNSVMDSTSLETFKTQKDTVLAT